MIDIKPIESFRVVGFRNKLCDEPEVRDLEANYKEAIDMLINVLKVDLDSTEEPWIDVAELLKKHTGKSWQELTE